MSPPQLMPSRPPSTKRPWYGPRVRRAAPSTVKSGEVPTKPARGKDFGWAGPLGPQAGAVTPRVLMRSSGSQPFHQDGGISLQCHGQSADIQQADVPFSALDGANVGPVQA